MSHRNQIQCLRNEFHVITFDVTHHHYVLLCQKVQRQVVHRVPQYALLNQKHISTGSYYLLHHVQYVSSFLLQDLVHLLVVLNRNAVLNVSLRSRKAELQQRNLSILYRNWTTSRLTRLLVCEYDTLNQLGVVDCTTQFLNNLYVTQINVSVFLNVNKSENSIYGDRSQLSTI